jgi:hypothetical protein
MVLLVLSVSIVLMTAAGASDVTIRQSTVALNKSTIYEASRVPDFGGYSGTDPSPALLPVGVKSHTDDSVPDDIFMHQIQRPGNKLPYRDFNDYTRGGATGEVGELAVVVMESTVYKLVIDPAHGAKMLSLTYKPTNQELVFRNPVFQPAALGRLNAWTSGGVEWNWPRLGHHVHTVSPLFVAEVDTNKGPMLRLYEFDREMNTTMQVDLFLEASTNGSDASKTALYAHTKVANPNAKGINAYWWTNIGVKIEKDSRALYPADYAISNGPHGLFRVPYPHFADCSAAGNPAACITHHRPLTNLFIYSRQLLSMHRGGRLPAE